MVNLDRTWYTIVEIAYLLKRNKRTVRELINKQSRRDPKRKLLVAEKHGGIWRVQREDLIFYMQETYGGSS